jgi:hypothetical protein
MRFLADESVDAPIVQILREKEHDVLYVCEIFPSVEPELY